MGKRKSDQWNHINNGPEFIIITITIFLELCTGLGNWSWNSEMETDKVMSKLWLRLTTYFRCYGI